MSLLGKLEDLPLADILQIVYLSRRTGILEVHNSTGKHCVFFQRGLLVDARSPDLPNLIQALLRYGRIELGQVKEIEALQTRLNEPLGTILMDMNMITAEDLAQVQIAKITSVIQPLLTSDEGEFNFILSEGLSDEVVEYESKRVFREGGLAPQKILAKEGERIVPLAGLKESMLRGKNLIRGALTGETSSESPGSAASAVAEAADQVVPFPREIAKAAELTAEGATAADFAAESSETAPETQRDEAPLAPERLMKSMTAPPLPEILGPPGSDEDDLPELEAEGNLDALDATDYAEEEEFAESIVPRELDMGGLMQDRAPREEARFSITPDNRGREDALEERIVVILEQDPLIRVSAKRAFIRQGVKTYHYNSVEEYLGVARRLLEESKFFVAIVSVPRDEGERERFFRLIAFLKKENRRIPVVVLSGVLELKLRHRCLSEGCNLYLTKPAAGGPGGHGGSVAEDELNLFADELLLVSDRYFQEWEEGPLEAAPRPGTGGFFDLAKKDKVNRSFGLLKSLINELANPNEISEVSLMILRLAAEYVERAILFLVGRQEFVGLGGFGLTGDLLPMNLRARKIRIPLGEHSIFSEVITMRKTHQGKLKRTPWNEALINSAGKVFPNEVVVIPILNRERVIAVLYGDNAEFKKPIGNVDGLEIFLSQAGFAFENALILKKRTQTKERV